MQDFKSLAEARYSCRSFKPDAIPQEAVDAILHAAAVAPTAANRQPQKILVLQSAEALAKLKLCTGSHFNCPLAFIIAYDKDVCWKRAYDGKLSGDIDDSIVTTHMMLQAYDLGIGSTWVMWYDPAAVTEQFAIPENWETTAILVMGYPSDEAKPSPGHSACREMTEMVTVL